MKLEDPYTRIQQLETELQDIIEYLGRLPYVPETTRVLQHAESVLAQELPPVGFEGTAITPTGYVPLRVRVFGNQATVSCDVPEATAHALWRLLMASKTVTLKPIKS